MFRALHAGHRPEGWPSGLRRRFAKPVYWETDTEGSNPSPSASQSSQDSLVATSCANSPDCATKVVVPISNSYVANV